MDFRSATIIYVQNENKNKHHTNQRQAHADYNTQDIFR